MEEHTKLQWEDELARLLRQLPIACTIIRRPDGIYVWQCLDGQGTVATMLEATREALAYLIGRVVGDAAALEDLQDTYH